MVDDKAFTLDQAHDRLRDLSEVLSGEKATEMDQLVVAVARDLPERWVTAPEMPLLVLPVETREERSDGGLANRGDEDRSVHGTDSRLDTMDKTITSP
ncbi:MAG: hypothetical protein JO252_06545 [Planctomycetaceae bacterium]|nr:hypothetical protein [Planctomycetaceae bacterium]